MTRLRRLVWLMMSVLLVACQTTPSAFECHDSLGCLTLAAGEPLKLAALQTLSGGSAPGGTEQLNTIQLVLAQHNNEFLGHPIQLQIEDELCSTEGGANAALKVIADPQTVAILGTNCSGAGLAAGKIMSEAGLVMISSSNTSPLLTAVGGTASSGWVSGYFRTAWNDTEMGKAAATFAWKQLNVRRAAVIHAGDAYSKGLADVFTQVFEAAGGEVVSEVTIDTEENDQSPALEAVALSGAELVFFSLGSPETGSQLVTQARAMPELEQLRFIGGEGMLSEVFIRETGEAGVGVYILGPGAPASAANDALREAYRTAYATYPPSFYYSFTHDAVELLWQALQRATTQDADGTLHIGRQALRDALYATARFEGLTGTLSCNRFGDCGVATLNILQLTHANLSVEDARAEVVYVYTSAP